MLVLMMLPHHVDAVISHGIDVTPICTYIKAKIGGQNVKYY
jgi:hypothetical protein